MNTKSSFLGVKRRDLQPNRHLWADCLENVESSIFHNPLGLHSLLQGLLFFTVMERLN
jgi:hypothetical protein